MDQKHFFANAKWVGSANRSERSFSILRGHFQAEGFQKVSLHILGLGFFKCYINGICVNPDTFLPLSSDYEASLEPKGEKLSGHRIYVPSFDITSYVTAGDNTIAIHYGGGWYTHFLRPYGLPKVIYGISVESGGVTTYFGSDEACRIGDSYVYQYDFISTEMHNYTLCSPCFAQNYDDSAWGHAVLTESPDTEYCETNCPWDGFIEEIPIKAIGRGSAGTVYDCGKNLTGVPVLQLQGGNGEEIQITFSEELLPDGRLDPNCAHGQLFSVITDGTFRTVQPEFTWFGFRYFEVVGSAVPSCVKFIHAQIPVTSHFECDNDTLNWIYQTFIHTMLCNMHTGIPSDCPHLERRGYTGDGQLTCHAVLSTLGARTFYEKWLQDIADGQDQLSGRIHNTAPYILSGGGPGGWGCAIVEVPYQLYRHYGDPRILTKYYGNMRRYLDYLETASEFGLVTKLSENYPGIACLGDWCEPNTVFPDKDILYCEQQSIIPPPYVNTYFMVKTLMQMCEIAKVIGRDDDIPEYTAKIELRKRAMRAAYFNTLDNSFLMNLHGANAFAAELGIGAEKTYPHLKSYYQKIGHYDTGIFATDVLTRILFQNGDGELAVELLTGDGDSGFENWRKHGATTFFEYWDIHRSRSHNHPMFGAAVACFFEYLLGIRQRDQIAGYSDLCIAPQAVSKFQKMSGSMETPNGTVKVSYQKKSDGIHFLITLPPHTKAEFSYSGQTYPLSEGENTVRIAHS